MINNNTNKISYISIFILFTTLICSSNSLKASYEISKTYIKSSGAQPSVIKMGKLKIFQQGQINQAYIQSNQPVFISPQQIKRHQTVILVFKNEKTGKQYRTAITKLVQRAHSEKIVVVLSSSKEVIGFNYVNTRVANQDISVELEEPQRGVDHVFKVETQQKQIVQQESFFSKYKWPLIIGGVVLYMTMTGAGGAAGSQGQGQPAQQ